MKEPIDLLLEVLCSITVATCKQAHLSILLPVSRANAETTDHSTCMMLSKFRVIFVVTNKQPFF
jgi:hypothetical protein